LIAEEARVRRMIKEGMEARRNSEMEMDKGDGMMLGFAHGSIT
jgi:hypothetical protein